MDNLACRSPGRPSASAQAMLFAFRCGAWAIAAVIYLCAGAGAYAQSRTAPAADHRASDRLVVLVMDQSQSAVPDARVEINLGEQLVFAGQTDGPDARNAAAMQERISSRRQRTASSR